MLLTNPLFAAGTGLLAASGPSLSPTNPWTGISQGLLAAQQARAYEQEMGMNKLRHAALRTQQERQQAQNAWAASQSDPLARAFPEEAAAAQMAALSKPVETAQLTTAGELNIPGVDPNLPVQIKTDQAGHVLGYDFAPAGTVAPHDTSAQRDYEYAVNQGFNGSFVDWQRAMSEAKATRITLGEEKTITPTDAQNMRMPDGMPPPPGMTYAQFGAVGGRYVTAADRKIEETDAKGADASSKAQPAVNDYVASVERWRNAPTDMESAAAMHQERRRLAQMVAQARNPGRAPTDADVENALKDIPSPISMSDLLSTKTGGDPFTAKMEVIAKELGVTIASPRLPSDVSPAAIDLKKKYPNLDL